MEPGLSVQEYSLAWDKAIEQNIVEEIGSYMAEDWICVATDGGITTKSSFLGWIASGDLVHTSMHTDEITVKLYGTTGIVVCKGTSSGFYLGNPFSFYEWSTSVFIYDNNKWQCVSTMLTPAAT